MMQPSILWMPCHSLFWILISNLVIENVKEVFIVDGKKIKLIL